MRHAPTQILDFDARTLSQLIHTRAVSCREVMEATLARIEGLNPIVNAIIMLRERSDLLREADDRDGMLARGESLGWMHGLPQAIKDLADVKGFPTTRGSPLFSGQPEVDGIFVERVRAAGAIFVGKTNTPEFGLGGQTYNTRFGVTANAYDRSLTSGGSSGGVGVAVALGMLAVADGSDMMGSLRTPAAFNNVFGFRPSLGRVPQGGPVGDLFYQQFTIEGPMGRSVADVAMLLSTMAGYDSRAPLSSKERLDGLSSPLSPAARGLRIGWLGDLDGHLPIEAGILALCETALGMLGDMGAEVEPVSLGFPPHLIWDSWVGLRAFLFSGAYGRLSDLSGNRDRMKPEALYEIDQGRRLSGQDVYRASEIRSRWYRHVLSLFERYDTLVLPSAQVFAFSREIHWPEAISGHAMDSYHRWLEVVVPASLAGLPSISVPVGFDETGRAMGMQLIGRPKGDHPLLQLAHAYDLATRWPEQRRPDVFRTPARSP